LEEQVQQRQDLGTVRKQTLQTRLRAEH
jgi:hypothetical protein